MMFLPMVAGAEPVEIKGIYYELVSKLKQAEVTKNPKGNYTGSVDIPPSVSYGGVEYSVTSIGEDAFRVWGGGTGLTSVTIPNSVTSIGDCAFWWCDELTSITIPNSVTSIGYGAFGKCSSLTSVKISNNVTTLNGTFYACTSLTSVTIPNSVTSLGCGNYIQGTFTGCTSLTSITIPNSVTNIGGFVFSGCI